MKMVVIGAGSVGLAVAATLVASGADVHVVARGPSVDALRAQGIKITGVLGEHVIAPGRFSVADTDTLLPPCDGIIVTTKAYEVTAALQPFLSVFAGANPPFILLLQNGWGVAQEVKQTMPAGTPVFSGSLITGIERLSPVEIRINGHDQPVQIGSLFRDSPERIRPLADLLQKAFLPFTYEKSIEPILLKKLLFNLCLNPLSAILKSTYGGLRDNEYSVGLMEELADEAVRTIAETRNLTLYEDGGDYVMNDLIPNRVSKNSKHRSSMLQDIEAGRKTEIGYINGAISKMGRECGIRTPCNDMIVSLILALESANRQSA